MFLLSILLYQFRASLQLQKRIAGTITDLPPSLVLYILKMSLLLFYSLCLPSPYFYLS